MRLQSCATKYILEKYSLSVSYCETLLSLKLLPLMYFFEFLDVMFFIKCIKFPNQSFLVLKFVSFPNVNTRSSSFSKLSHQYRRTRLSQHSYFCRLTWLWNSLPPIDLTLSLNTIKPTLRNYFIDHFISHFDSTNTLSYHIVCPCDKCSSCPIHTNFTL